MSPALFKVRKELVDALSHSSLLQFLRDHGNDTTALREMLESSTVEFFNKGDVILRQGDESESMYFIADGKVEVAANGKAICSLGRLGDVFGEMGVITGQTRSATITAITEVTCLVTSKEFTLRLDRRENIAFHNLMQQALSRVLMGRLTNSNEELSSTKTSLDQARSELDMLRMLSETQESEIKQLKEKNKDGFRGTQGEKSKKSKKTSGKG